MVKDYYTTTEVAKVLSVSADTVLKWVKAKKIISYRTPGGHYRIPKEEVAKLLPEGALDEVEEPARASMETSFRYCWDFYGENGTVKKECVDCVVYKTRSFRCYEMRDIPGQFNHPHLHCQTECTDCEYYRVMHGHATCTLVVTRSKNLLRTLEQQANNSDIAFRFASSEYECSYIVEKFRPDYVVVDCSFGASRTRAICQNLRRDERIPFVRIILSSQKHRGEDFCDSDAFGWITKPFSIQQIEELVEGTSKH
ncbi:MAG: excisionase family DNA-binding protein [Planctomycetota bacterium]|jgi:excisionase family DNA binding protein